MTISLQIEQFVVFGHSLGGHVSLAIAKSYPQAVLGFGLINSTSYADSKEKKENRIKTIDFINKHGGAFFLESFVPNLFTPANRLKLNKDVSRVTQMGNNIPEAVLIAYISAMSNRPDLSGLLSQQENILLVAGILDSHFSYNDIISEIGLLKQRKNGHIFNNVAHMSMIEADKQLKLVITDFLDSI